MKMNITRKQFEEGYELSYRGTDGRVYFAMIERTGMFGWQKVVFRDGLGKRVETRTGYNIAGGLYREVSRNINPTKVVRCEKQRA